MYCDTLVVMKAGSVVAAESPDDVLTWEVYGVSATVTPGPRGPTRS